MQGGRSRPASRCRQIPSMQKRVETLWSRPFFRFADPHAGDRAPVSRLPLASMLPGLPGFLDRRLMIPTVAAIGFAGGRGGGLGNGFGFFIAASAESLPAP